MNWTSDTQILVQGITKPGILEYTETMRAYGTNIVAGVNPGQGGKTIADIPVFDLVDQAIASVGEIQTSLIFVEPYQVQDAALEAVAAGIKEIILCSSGVPPLDMVNLLKTTAANETLILGPGTNGIIIPEKILLGTCQAEFYQKGTVGLISLSYTISNEIAILLNQSGFGESMVVNLGEDEIISSNLGQWLSYLEEDHHTEVILLIGQAHQLETLTSEVDLNHHKKPIIAYVYGLNAPVKNTYKNAASIMAYQLSYYLATSSNAKDKISSLEQANIKVTDNITKIVDLVKKSLKKN